ncbi:MAG: hypothetical protein MPJ04_07110, partial [Nitrosopumilus sp.]|nr:hypothetical protein [Nitrosopumilus sp.]
STDLQIYRSTDLQIGWDSEAEKTQRVVDDRKKIAAYYTKLEAAALLTNLLLPASTNEIWSSKEKLGNIRIVDFACGTGMLLTQAWMAEMMGRVRC